MKIKLLEPKDAALLGLMIQEKGVSRSLLAQRLSVSARPIASALTGKYSGNGPNKGRVGVKTKAAPKFLKEWKGKARAFTETET